MSSPSIRQERAGSAITDATTRRKRLLSDEAGLAVFDLIRSWRHDHNAVLCAFDLLELDGQDLRCLPIELRKAGFAQLLQPPSLGIAVNEHHVGDGNRMSEDGAMRERIYTLVPEQMKVIHEALTEKTMRIRQKAREIPGKDPLHQRVIGKAQFIDKLAEHFKVPKGWLK
jgi:hypothetical protein